jgi:hypothetical protein
MKEKVEEYKENIKEFLNNKKYMAMLILVSMLSYGFFLTHFWISVDDISADRYVLDTYILSSGRWGTFLVNNILFMTKFIPFWADFVSCFLMGVIAILLCAFFKRISNGKIRLSSYILFSTIYISFPQICSFIVYQSTKIPVIFSNLLMVIALIFIYENFVAGNKNKGYLLIGIILAFPISMYESCCQTFIALMLIITFIHIKYNTDFTDKKIFSFWVKCCLSLAIGIIANVIINKFIYIILDFLNMRREVFANKTLMFGKEFFQNESYIRKNLAKALLTKKADKLFNSTFKYVREFYALCIIGFVITLITSIKEKKLNFVCIYVLLIFSNFLLLLMMSGTFFRICFSWTITVGFTFLIINECVHGKKEKIFWVLSIYVILMQSKYMNTLFYNSYVEYQRTLTYANSIVSKLQEANADFSKPILFLQGEKSLGYTSIAENANGEADYFEWGFGSFYGEEIEIINFFNEMGYNFKIVDNVEEAKKVYENLDDEIKEEDIIELDDFIVVKLSLK